MQILQQPLTTVAEELQQTVDYSTACNLLDRVVDFVSSAGLLTKISLHRIQISSLLHSQHVAGRHASYNKQEKGQNFGRSFPHDEQTGMYPQTRATASTPSYRFVFANNRFQNGYPT